MNPEITCHTCGCPCHCELEKFLEKTCYNRKTGEQEKSLCHGLLRCKSDTHNCGIIHNRDKNAVKNMLNIVNDRWSGTGQKCT